MISLRQSRKQTVHSFQIVTKFNLSVCGFFFSPGPSWALVIGITFLCSLDHFAMRLQQKKEHTGPKQGCIPTNNWQGFPKTDDHFLHCCSGAAQAMVLTRRSAWPFSVGHLPPVGRKAQNNMNSVSKTNLPPMAASTRALLHGRITINTYRRLNWGSCRRVDSW